MKILQWPRRCLENHLIDFNVLTDLLKDELLVSRPIRNIGELQRKLKELAKSQLADLAIIQVYKDYQIIDMGLRSREVQGKSFSEAASLLFDRIDTSRQQICELNRSDWITSFIQNCEERKREIEDSWEATWQENCDGKRLFKDLQRDLGINEPLIRFKIRVIKEMKNGSSESWRTMESLLKDLVGD